MSVPRARAAVPHVPSPPTGRRCGSRAPSRTCANWSWRGASPVCTLVQARTETRNGCMLVSNWTVAGMELMGRRCCPVARHGTPPRAPDAGRDGAPLEVGRFRFGQGQPAGRVPGMASMGVHRVEVNEHVSGPASRPPPWPGACGAFEPAARHADWTSPPPRRANHVSPGLHA